MVFISFLLLDIGFSAFLISFKKFIIITLTNPDLLSYLYNIQYHLSLIITIPTALVSFQV